MEFHSERFRKNRELRRPPSTKFAFPFHYSQECSTSTFSPMSQSQSRWSPQWQKCDRGEGQTPKIQTAASAAEEEASKQPQWRVSNDFPFWIDLVQLMFSLFNLVRFLYETLATCLAKCWRIITCQRKQQQQQERATSGEIKKDIYAPTPGYYGNSSPFLRTSLKYPSQLKSRNYRYPGLSSSSRAGRASSNNPEFSSDDSNCDDEEEETYLNACRAYGVPRHDNNDEGQDLPFVRWIDNLIYFFSLYRNNFPAFTHELKTRVCCDNSNNVTASESLLTNYRHNIKRPRIVNSAAHFLNSRKSWFSMTRVVGPDPLKAWLLNMALLSRLLVFLIQATAFNVFPLFKHDNDGFKFTPEETYGKLLDPVVNATLGGYINWDAHYFLHISVYGYTSENMIAFFPLLPMSLWIPSRVTYLLFGSFISLSSLVIIFGALLNTWLFLKCTGNIYELSKLWSGGSSGIISTACIIFSFNPASIFFSGLYTETFFAYLTSSVILSLFRREYWKPSLFAGLSCLCRSNGILNLGFIAAYLLQQNLSFLRRSFSYRVLVFVVQCLPVTVITVLPFALFQLFSMKLFCDNDALYENPSSIPPYCVVVKGALEQDDYFVLPYSYVQKKYWSVGFLQYFQVKQIPNFILAAPVLYILASESLSSLKLSIVQMLEMKSARGIYFALQALHGLFLVLFCFFFVHVQVSTRMIMAACPYLFVYLADLYESDVDKFRRHEIDLPLRPLLVTLWCGLYFLIGTVGFSLALPWT